MNEEKKQLIQVTGQKEPVLVRIQKMLEERCINASEVIERLAQPSGDDTIQKIVDAITKLFPEARKSLVLKFLKLIASGVAFSSESFTKESLFGSYGPVWFWPDSDFTKKIEPKLPEIIPAFHGVFTKSQLTEDGVKYLGFPDFLYDLSNLEDLKPFTTKEKFIALAKELFAQPPRFESNALLSSSCPNIFIVAYGNFRFCASITRLEGGKKGYYGWRLSHSNLQHLSYHNGCCIFYEE